MDVISQGPSNAASKASASTSSKPTATKTTNGRNAKAAVNDDFDEDDVSDEDMAFDKESDSDDYVVSYPYLHVIVSFGSVMLTYCCQFSLCVELSSSNEHLSALKLLPSLDIEKKRRDT